MESMVVPVEDSFEPRLAMRAAFSLAERLTASVSLVSACNQDRADEVEAMLAAAATPFDQIAPFSTRTLDASPVDAILEAAGPSGALICMRSHARSGLSRVIFGSVAESLIRRSPQPVLCVGPRVTDIALAKERLDTLVCTDDSAATSKVLEAAATFAEAVDSSCTVSQVVGPDEDVSFDGGPPPRPLRDEAEQHCRQSADLLATQGITTATRVLNGHPASSIVQHAGQRGASFIVVGTSGRTGVTRHTLGSVAASVLRDAHCPVLVVPTMDRAD